MTADSLEPTASVRVRATDRGAKWLATRFGSAAGRDPVRPVFLVGCGRSGTTLLERLLGMHPDIADWSEANEIWDPEWFPWRDSSAARPPVEFDIELHEEGWRLQNLHRMEDIRRTFGAFQAIRRRPVFLNKTPYHSFRLHYLREYFPDAKLIYIRRDGRAVVNSYRSKLLRQGKLREWPLPERDIFVKNPDQLASQLAHYWVATCDEADARDAELGLEADGHMLRLSYEDLCADAPEVVGQVCEFVGISPSGVQAALKQHPVVDTSDKWRTQLDASSQSAIVEAIGDDLVRLGYE